MGPRGDAIAEADWCVGEMMACLDSLGLLENTLIVFTSDNGPVLNDGYRDGAVEMQGNHDPRGGLRGGKYSLFDAGTHVPFFVYWKGRIQPAVSDALVCQLDLFASFATLVGRPLEGKEACDSQDLLPALLGESTRGRDELIVEAQGKLAIRKGGWILLPPYGGPATNLTGNELGNMPDFTLYNVDADPAQTTDVASQHPDIVDALKSRFFTLTQGYYKAEVEEVELQ